MSSPITSLVEILEEVRQKSLFYRDQLQGNEAATRAALIDPVLRALGWEVADPSRVLVERTQTIDGKQLKVDYALIHEGEVKIVVEAKKLGGDLKESFLQVVNYSFGVEVGDIFITDGLKWRHYHDLRHNNQSPVRELHIGVHPLPDVAVYLIQHLDSALIAPETQQIDELGLKIENLEQKVSALEHSLAQPAVGQSKLPANQSQAPAQHVQTALTLQELRLTEDYEGTTPRQLRLPDGRRVEIASWSAVLIECCRYALDCHPPLRVQLPIANSAGRSVSLISATKPPKKRGGSFVVVDNASYWVDTNYPANGIVANVLHIVKRLPLDKRPSVVAVAYS
jgi:hypothetical protein